MAVYGENMALDSPLDGFQPTDLSTLSRLQQQPHLFFLSFIIIGWS